MHIEIQVALNFVISYLYNKLPRRRVNIFGEELEKALKDKFQGHWYPEKPFKGSAFRCLKTGDPIDSVLERAARESGVPIADILENLPNELSVWVDPGEVSYRIGEKGAVKILYSENSDNHEDNTSADREVNKTFNPEAQCFRPIDTINTSLNGLSLSPKTSPHAGSSPHSASSTSPTYKGNRSPNAAGTSAATPGGSFMQRTQAQLTFTTATFAQTKFGSTKLKTSSKRANSSSYRMSPTEFSNYIKQRAMQQQLHHGHGPAAPQPNHFGPIGPVSPARSLSPNPLSLGLNQSADPFYFPNMAAMGMYPQFNGHRNLFDAPPHFHPEANGLYGSAAAAAAAAAAANANGHGKFNAYLEPHGFYGLGGHMPQQQQQQQPPPQQQQHPPQQMPPPVAAAGTPLASAQPPTVQQTQQQNNNTKLMNGNEAANNKDNSHATGNQNVSSAANITVTVSSAANSNAEIAAVAAATAAAAAAAAASISPVPPTSPAAISAANNTAAAVTVNSNAAANANVNGNASVNLNANTSAAAAAAAAAVVAANNQDSNNSKLIDGLNSFYSSATGSYQQLLVAN